MQELKPWGIQSTQSSASAPLFFSSKWIAAVKKDHSDSDGTVRGSRSMAFLTWSSQKTDPLSLQFGGKYRQCYHKQGIGYLETKATISHFFWLILKPVS